MGPSFPPVGSRESRVAVLSVVGEGASGGVVGDGGRRSASYTLPTHLTTPTHHPLTPLNTST